MGQPLTGLMAGLPERRSREIRSARISRRPPSFAVTLVALAIVFALAWSFFARSGPVVPTPTVEGTRGTYTWRQTASDAGEDGSFSAVAGGNAGGEAAARATVLGAGPPAAAYDAATLTESMRVSHGPVVTEVRTIGAWPPVWRVATHSPLDYQGLSAIVRSAVEDGDDAVGIKPLKDGERTVWRAAIRLDGRPVELVLDQVTGLVTWYSDGRSTFTATVDWASPPPAGETYTVQVPAGTEVRTTTDDDHTYASSTKQAGRTAGYAPLVSDLAPDGYALKAIATFDSGDRPADWIWGDRASGAVGDGPLPGAAEPAIAQLYARGLSWFTVEQVGPKSTGLVGESLRNGLRAATREKLSYEEATLQFGEFSGETAATWYQASGPSLLVVGRRRAVFVTGALTRQELIAFAEGLKPLPAGAPE